MFRHAAVAGFVSIVAMSLFAPSVDARHIEQPFLPSCDADKSLPAHAECTLAENCFQIEWQLVDFGVVAVGGHSSCNVYVEFDPGARK